MALRQQVSLLGMEQRPGGRFLPLTLNHFILCPALVELLQHLGEGRCITRPFDQHFYRIGDRFQEFGEPFITLCRITQAAMGDPVQELTRGMLALGKEARV